MASGPNSEKLHQRLWPSSQSARRLAVDFVVIFGFAILLRIFTYNLQLFEWFYEFSREHEEFQLDEILVSYTILSLAFIVFGLRRIQDQRRELRLRVAAEMHATMLSLQDPLTGLPNRRRFQEVLSALAAAEGTRHAVLVLDLDQFKPVNDVFGHATGDEALRTVARRLKALGDPRIVCARLGGDEFAMVIRDVQSSEEAARIAAMVIATIEIPIPAAGTEHHVEVSIGISMMEDKSTPAEESLRRADVALYRAKDHQGSAYSFYEEAMDVELKVAVRMEHDLKEALANQQIVPHYQPIVDLRTGAILKFEALARWRHPTRGWLPPASFIPIAEGRGLIAEVTEAILRQACRDALAWPDAVLLSVNLSPVLLQSKAFGLRIVKILEEVRLPPHRLEIEITEMALKTDSDVVAPFLNNLRSLGIRISLDDFGTGFSSLSRLRQLPFDDIKIDRSFVQSMSREAQGSNFVWTIMQLGHGLKMTVTAEGIEDIEQRDRLIAEGCTQGQGFLFSEAVPASETIEMLKTRRRAAFGAPSVAR